MRAPGICVGSSIGTPANTFADAAQIRHILTPLGVSHGLVQRNPACLLDTRALGGTELYRKDAIFAFSLCISSGSDKTAAAVKRTRGHTQLPQTQPSLPDRLRPPKRRQQLGS